MENKNSFWYSGYCQLVNWPSFFDANKGYIVIGENYWRGVSFDEFRQSIKDRYVFLAENALFLLAPLLERGVNFDKALGNCIDFVQCNFSENIYLNDDIYLSVLLEQYLFCDDYKNSILYQKILYNKESSKYLEKYKQGLLLINNRLLKEDIRDVNIAMFMLLKSVRGFLLSQKETINSKRKLCVLDEYFRIVRYTNNDLVWTSGYLLNEEDIKNNLKENDRDPFTNFDVNIRPFLNRGVGYTRLIHSFGVTKSRKNKTYSSEHLSEKDKQEIYLRLHDELPHDLEIPCVLEETNLDCMIDERLKRPDNTNPCGVSFRIKEGNIFVHGSSFYHLCNSCGYIVKVPINLLSSGIQSRIRTRCSKDKNLFRKMELISELQALDDQSLPHHKVLFKN